MFDSITPIKQYKFREILDNAYFVVKNKGTISNVTFKGGYGVFNGTNSGIDYFNCSIGVMQDFSVRVRFIVDENNGDFNFLCSHYDGLTNNNTLNLSVLNTGKIRFYLRTNNLNFKYIDSTQSIVYGRMYEVVCTLNNASKEMKMYINGLPETVATTNNGTLTTLDFKNAFAVGIRAFDGGIGEKYRLKGKISLVEIEPRILQLGDVRAYHLNITNRELNKGLVLDFDPRQGILKDNTGLSITNFGATLINDGGEYTMRAVSGYCEYDNGPSFAGVTDKPFTIHLKTKRILQIVGSGDPIFAKATSSDLGEYYVIISTTGRVYFRLVDNTNLAYIGKFLDEDRPLNEERTYTFTYSGTGGLAGMKYYKNGIIQTTTSDAVGTYIRMRATSTKVRVASRGVLTGNMTVKRAKIFDYELNADEVLQLYNLLG